jgi:hypothetical protein
MAMTVWRTGAWSLQIVKRSDVAGFEVLPKRWIVERTFAWISRNRRPARDFERYASPTASHASTWRATWSTHSRRIDPISLSAKPFCQGEPGAMVGVIWPLPRWLLQPLVAMLDFPQLKLYGPASLPSARAHSLRRRLRQSFTRGRPPLVRPFEQPLAILGIIRLLISQSALLGAQFV